MDKSSGLDLRRVLAETVWKFDTALRFTSKRYEGDRVAVEVLGYATAYLAPAGSSWNGVGRDERTLGLLRDCVDTLRGGGDVRTNALTLADRIEAFVEDARESDRSPCEWRRAAATLSAFLSDDFGSAFHLNDADEVSLSRKLEMHSTLQSSKRARPPTGVETTGTIAKWIVARAEKSRRSNTLGTPSAKIAQVISRERGRKK